jgi:hypothetical protein
VKNWLGWSKGGPPTKLIKDGNIFWLLRSSLPQNVGNPLTLVRRLMEKRNCTFSFRSVHPDEISKIIDNLKQSKIVELTI